MSPLQRPNDLQPVRMWMRASLPRCDNQRRKTAAIPSLGIAEDPDRLAYCQPAAYRRRLRSL
jgi:hypothetical protein